MGNTPNIRFKGFTDDWEQRKFKDVFDGLQNNTFSRADLNYESGAVKNVHYGDVLIKFGDFIDVSKDELPFITDESQTTKYNSSFLQDGDIIIADTAEDSTVGKCSEIVGFQGVKLLSGLHTIPCRPKEKYAPKFMGYYINSDAYHKQLIPLMQGIKVTSISKSALQETDMILPKSFEEQAQIGEYFSNIDHLITLHQRKCDEMKKMKKFMLQKMFPKNGQKNPEIRFDGFTDDWEQRKLGDVVEDYVEKTTVEDQYPVLTSSQQKGIVLQDDYFSGERVSQNGNIGYFVIPRGYFTFRSRSDNDVFVFNRNDAVDMGIISYFYPVFKPKGVNSDFLLRRLNYGLEDQIKINSEGTGQHVLSLKKFKNIVGVFPSYEEQKKIGSYFSQIDHLITLHQRKCDEMKKMKKFMLQKMFPKNGQKNPEIRFDGFTDDWEQRKFSDYYKMSSGCAFKMSDYCEDGIGLINGESIQHGIINDDNLNHLPESFIEQYPDFILKEGDIVVGLNRPITNGNLKIARIPSKYNDSLLYQRAGKVVYKEECDRDFSYVLLSQEILKHTLVEAVGSDQPFISTSKLDKWQMMIPKDIEEQHKIGEYFSNLDNLITLHQRKVDNLKNLKKYMLQNMFV